MWGLCILVAASSLASPLSEKDAKTGFLYHLAWYTRWPLPDWDPEHPLVLGIVGTDPFGPALDALLADKRVQRHPLVVWRMQPQDDIRRCHLLFIALGAAPHLAAILDTLGDAPVLTGSDLPGFTQAGGMVYVGSVERRLVFQVNQPAVQRTGLHLSSQVLKLAKAP